MTTEHLDVLIIGAGLSGINAAYYLKQRMPHKRFAILEARAALGGTWDLFRYPGVRSDSDMHTLGFGFRPWEDPRAIADGDAILEYLQRIAREEGIEPMIRFGQRVVQAEWEEDSCRWRVQVQSSDGDEATRELTCDFLWGCTGYYRYDQGYTPQFEGADTFAGQIVHPQHWPEELDVSGKRVIVIGSGATAVTLVPALAELGAEVTMLQRSPSFVFSMPRVDPIAETLRALLPDKLAYAATRWKNVVMGQLTYYTARRYPERARAFLLKKTREALGARASDLIEHFTPSYAPWDERLCLVPDDDLFEAIATGAAQIVTDHIEAFREHGIELRSGAQLPADVIVTATGLQVQVFGGIDVRVGGESVSSGDRYLYKGMMLNDVPNMVISIGYTNASWTLKCELISAYVCRLLQYMEDHGFDTCVPHMREDVSDQPLIEMKSGYIKRAESILPKQGERAPWRLYQNYFMDRLALGHGKLEDRTMHFGRCAD